MYKSLLDVVADAQSLDELTVLDDVVLLDVGEKTTTTADEHEQATTGVEVLLMGLHVLGQLLDALAQDGDLNLGVAGVDRGVTELAVSSALRSLETVIVSPFVLRRPRATRFASDWEAAGGASNQGRGTNRSVCYHKQPAPAHHHRPNMNSIARRR